MSVVQSWRSWWSGEKEQEEGENSQETSEEKKDEEEGQNQAIPPAWVKGFGDLVQSVGSYATTLTETVKTKVTETASGTIVGEFQRQQDEFARSLQRQRDANVPPWVGYNEEEQMRAQILELSADSRNVLRDPPPGVEFPFDYKASAPVAIATMSEDQRLKALRFDLVPKKISEEIFWRNYFYRVSLIKQSLQLSSLASAEPSTPPSVSGSTSSPRQPLTDEASPPEPLPPSAATTTTDIDVSTDEFASDQPFNSDAVSREAVQSELDQLGVSEATAEDAWEAELQADLEGLDLAATGTNGDGVSGVAGGEEDWEEELQQMLELHSTNEDDDNKS